MNDVDAVQTPLVSLDNMDEIVGDIASIMEGTLTDDDIQNAAIEDVQQNRLSVQKRLEEMGLPSDARIMSQRKAEDWWIEMSRKSPLYFGWYVFGYRPAKHHIRWAKQIFHPDAGKYQIIIAPRESAKTTWALIFFLWYISHNPWSSNMIISVSLAQAKQRLYMLAETIEHNERYRRVFPHVKKDNRKSWNQTEFSIWRSDLSYGQWTRMRASRGDPKTPTVLAMGIGSSAIIGLRVSGIMLMDDIMDSHNIATENLRNQLERDINTQLLPTLMDDARLIHITTRWSEDDIAQRQINTGMFEWSVTRAFETDEEGHIILDERGLPRSYWPEQWPIQRLLEVRRIYGSTVFKLMYLNIPTGLSGDLFNIEWLRQDLPDPLPKFKHVFVSLDPAITYKARSDETAIAVVAVDYNNRFYLLNMFHGRLAPQETVKKFIEIWAKTLAEYKVQPYALIEAVAAQRLFITLLEAHREQTGTGIPNQNIITFTPTVDKVTRSRPFAAAAERGAFFMPQSGKEWIYAFQSQCIEFTGDQHGKDDLVDAVSSVFYYLRGDVKQGAFMTNASFSWAKPQTT